MEDKEYQALIDRVTFISQVQDNFSGILSVLGSVKSFV
jgi:hypothetical protein